jgi:hypothetical protein
MSSVFLSYRREDAEGQARALKSELVRLLGDDSVFMDVDSIALGRDFRQVLHERLQACDLVLVLIGRDWLDAKDGTGRRRIDNEADFVRQEIAAALKRNVPVTPVLLRGAFMPAPEQLPDDIKDLAYRNGFELGHSTWESDVKELVKRLGLDRTRAASNERPAEDVAPRPFLSGRLRASLVIAALAVAALVGTLYALQWRSRTAGNDPVSPAVEPSPPLQLPVGLGAIRITNLESRVVEVFRQDSKGDYVGAEGYAGMIRPDARTLQVPAGTYKLKFSNTFIDKVVVGSAQSRDIVLGTISVPGLMRNAEVFTQDSKGDYVGAPGYAGALRPDAPTLQVPPGTYKLKFDQTFIESIRVDAGKTVTPPR